jgi:sugar (glycoside-pentoside-hexuronide) transporter
VTTRVILLYSAPGLGLGFMLMFMGMYQMKYSTDVLGISPAAMAGIFLVSRLWDAFSDPLAGYWSDRTRTRLGRRRPWLLASAVPVGLLFIAMMLPPARLSGTGLVLWVGLSVVLYYSALTAFAMPHDSLGAELTLHYEDRNRVFGWRRVVFGVGAIAVFGFVGWLSALPPAEQRDALAPVALLAAALTTGLITLTGAGVRERPEYQGRGARRPFGAVRDVLVNPHARLLLAVFFLQQLAVATLSGAAAYFTHYVLGDPSLIGWLLGGFFVISIAAVPVWLALGRRFQKKPLALTAMLGVAAVIGALFFTGPGQIPAVIALAALGGALGAGLDILLPSLQADVIDWDEHRTGERKEGVYFSIWALGAKSAGALAGALLGGVLALSGFAPNQEQAASAQLAIRMLMSLVPAVCYCAGTLLFLRFSLDRAAHDAIRAELALRR